jgi:4'-phosphopantetheinyl transferase
MKIVSINIKDIMVHIMPCLDVLSKKRTGRIKKYIKEEDQLRCIGAGYLIAKELGVDEDRDFVYNGCGKPVLKDDSKHFNISHSGNWVVMVTSEKEVGIDVEQIKKAEIQVGKQCFQPDEYAYMTEEDTNKRFYTLWTTKESVMKATGKGLSLTPESFSVYPLEKSYVIIDHKKWYIRRYTIEPDYIVAVASSKNNFAEEIVNVNL